jgi:HAMP domain-containing protein
MTALEVPVFDFPGESIGMVFPEFYLNSFFNGSFVVLGICVAFAIFMLQLRNKSSATWHFGITLALLAFFNLAYMVRHGVYHPAAVYHRWATTGLILPVLIHFTQFLLRFPTVDHPVFARYMLAIQWAVHIILQSIFVWFTTGARVVYNFQGHYFDFDADKITEIQSIFIVVYLVISALVGVWRSRVREGMARWALLSLALILFFVMMVPAVLNTLSRRGIVTHELFQNAYSLSMILGLFVMITVFLNTTPDRTSFMSKIIGISLATFLLIMQVLGYLTISRRDSEYFALRKEQAGQVLLGAPKSKGDFSWIKERPLQTARQKLPDQAEWKSEGTQGFLSITGKNYVYYVWPDAHRKVLIEAGFRYESYRQYLHTAGFDFFVVTSVGIFLLLTLFPVFFYLALINPLNRVLAGVSEVNRGNLEVVVPVIVEDEIGVLARSFNSMIGSIKDARGKLQESVVKLEGRVLERTLSLQDSLTQTQRLKQQQDGDYFLTSLLLRPLGLNRVESAYLKVEFRIRQKKKFDFKHWRSEIGGDICVADMVRLKGENYIAILNADAMGKSIQGAGGAVVLGSAFNAILERSRASEAAADRFPENWIRDTFSELHKVFVVFDGTMLVSVFLGLIHEETGVMFHVNAEHPWAVLIRGGQASFITPAVPLRKLGIVPPGVDKHPWRKIREGGPFRVDTLQLHPGDILVLGSDGRDDIVLGINADSGERIINEDEHQFRLLAGQTNGDLGELEKALENTGEFSDDLSLMRIEVKTFRFEISAEDENNSVLASRALEAKDFIAALSFASHIHDVAKRSALKSQIFFKNKSYQSAIDEGLIALAENPLRHDIIYILMRCYRKLSMTKESLEWGERFRLRYPSHTGNLVHLAHLSLVAGAHADARRYAEEALAVKNDFEPALNILNYFESKPALSFSSAVAGKTSS